MRLRFVFPAAISLLAFATGCPTTGPGGGRDDDDVGVDYEEVPVGALVITEILAHPNVGRPEYVEVFNASDDVVNLAACQILDGGSADHSFTIAANIPIDPGGYALLGSAEFLGSSDGDLPVDVIWTDITLSQTDEGESVALSCPDGDGLRQLIDQVSFHWNGFDLRRGHGWQLAVDADAGSNDDPANWCEAPVQDDAVYAEVDGVEDYGTPGAGTVCETLGGAQPDTAGDVVITEILVDEFTGLREWFELHNPGSEPLDLRGCVLGDAPLVGDSTPNVHALDAEAGDTVLPAGGWLLLSKTDTNITPDGSLTADYPYGSLGFNNSEDQHLWLDCPVGKDLVRIDEIFYNWETFGSSFEGRSIALSANALDAEDNDNDINWCLARDEDLYFTVTDTTKEGDVTRSAWGSPGEANPACPVPNPFPAVGELVFTEILAHSAGSQIGTNEEWFELKHVGGQAVSLNGCTLVNTNQDESTDDSEIAAPLGLDAEPGEYIVFVKSSAADSQSCGLPFQDTYAAGIGFNNSDPESMSLLCPGPAGDVEVDRISFDGGFTPGVSWQLGSSHEDAVSNDDPANWCNDDVTAAWTWSCTVGDDTNYGTPGQPSTCP